MPYTRYWDCMISENLGCAQASYISTANVIFVAWQSDSSLTEASMRAKSPFSVKEKPVGESGSCPAIITLAGR